MPTLLGCCEFQQLLDPRGIWSTSTRWGLLKNQLKLLKPQRKQAQVVTHWLWSLVHKMERSHLDIVKRRAMSSGKCMVTEERSNFQWVLRMPQEVRRITNHYEEEDLSDVAIGEITEDSTESAETNHAIWKMHVKVDWRVNNCHGRDYREHGQFF